MNFPVAILAIVFGNFELLVNGEVYSGSAWPAPLLGSCKEIQTKYPAAISGDYNVRTQSGQNIRVYCEMAINGGGYTFLHPTAFYQITASDVKSIVTDTSSVLLRILRSDGTQKYNLLQQLDTYSSKPINIALNGDPAFRQPINAGYNPSPTNNNPQQTTTGANMGTPYLQAAFLTIADSTNNNRQGLRMNGQDVAFNNCDKNPNSYFAVFPNMAERPASGRVSDKGPVYVAATSTARNPPSHRLMPVDYYMFLELLWGGCGAYFETNESETSIFGGALGFR